jgi:putative addiction module killer protein
MESIPKEIVDYITPDGKDTYFLWRQSIKDRRTKDIVDARLERVKTGNYGDCKPVGEGVSELRFKSGIRIYFAEIGGVIVILLCGGNKKTQKRDIITAKEYWREFRAR